MLLQMLVMVCATVSTPQSPLKILGIMLTPTLIVGSTTTPPPTTWTRWRPAPTTVCTRASSISKVSLPGAGSDCDNLDET